MSNFNFLENEWTSLYKNATTAEKTVNSDPSTSAIKSRICVEETIHRIYEIEHFEIPYNSTLNSLMGDYQFKAIIPRSILDGLYIAKTSGNNAAHYGNKVSGKDALVALKYVFTFLKWFANYYSEEQPEIPALFDMQFVPKIGSERRKLSELQTANEKEQEVLRAEVNRLRKSNEEALEVARESEEALTQHIEQVKTAQEALVVKKQARQTTISSEFTEAETRLHIIDANLKEAGWAKLTPGRELEYKVKGMPKNADNPKGNGFVDYVLWGENGKPLALVEAKRTSKDIEVGRQQAFLYANCLEKEFGQRPIIFYTNGFEIKIWDDTFYSAPRRVYGFYTIKELEWLIERRGESKDVRDAKVNKEIAGDGRPYQIEAIQRVNESLIVDTNNGIRGNKREALLVMATGSGKTRTAAALVDVLMKGNWVKRVLFLADRNALVRQAKNNFTEFLPELSSVDLTQEKENDSTRLVFSTYPSMMNRIDNAKNEHGRYYGVGHFDLIIVDEAHRSVYNRYGAIFEYFDSLIVGLTATPKDSIDHNTFELFGCSEEDPTFAYELDDATPQYLVPFRNVDVSTKFLREGIKYNELSDKEKEEYEKTFEDASDGLFPEEIKSGALNKWLFNKDTVNQVLDKLMSNGLKIEGGDKIGRTIVFAANQKHAQFITDCFIERYPQFAPGFISVIHNKVSHSQSLIDAFCDKEKENNPQIAVSVDMMDTGVDAPRVLNLVFFKLVRSKSKFWQMIGRGTRLCPDVFGPEQPKTEFLIFDVCQNFEFFSLNPNGYEGSNNKPLTQQIFDARLKLSVLLKETGETENIELATGLLDGLHGQVFGLEKKRFQVKMQMKHVEEFQNRDRWNNLDSVDLHIIEDYLSALPVPEAVNENARRFDLMMLMLQVADLLMDKSKRDKYCGNLMNISEQLSGKYTIPAVAKAKATIESLKNEQFYEELTQRKIEEIRVEIRELVQYLESAKQGIYYTNFKDSEMEVAEGPALTGYGNNKIYKQRVESFIRENKTQIVISKINNNQPITEGELLQLEKILFDGDERGTKDDYVEQYGEQPLGVFVRSIVGLSEAAAQSVFSDFIQDVNLRADQISFINNIISFLTQNGVIEKKMLFESPFTNDHFEGLTGVFEMDDAHRIMSLVENINDNANVG
jgi:type I restriction enzyme R subunit